MKTLGYYNGKCGELSEMTVPMNDRACFFGDGVYEAEMCRNYRIFALDEHMDRLFRSSARLRIEIPMRKEEIKALLISLVRKMDTGNLLVYYQVTRGTAPRSHAFPENTQANIWVTLTPKEIRPDATPVSLITEEDTRFLHCDVKTLNLIPSVMANQRAKEAGCYECVFYRNGRRVTEGSHSNVHIIRGGRFYTAPADNLILAGIARERLLKACGRLGIPVSETPFTVEDLLEAEEILVSSSTSLCRRACQVDGRKAGMRRPELFEALLAAVYDEYYAETEAPEGIEK